MDELNITSSESKATCQEIKEYIFDKFGLKVSSLNIAQIKEKCGIKERENFNKPKSDHSRQANCTAEKEKSIIDAFSHFQMI